MGRRLMGETFKPFKFCLQLEFAPLSSARPSTTRSLSFGDTWVPLTMIRVWTSTRILGEMKLRRRVEPSRNARSRRGK
jgi:hypothetical protein